MSEVRGELHFGETKTGKNRTVPLALSARLSAILKRHPQRTDTPLLFHDREGKPLDVDRLNGILESAMRKADCISCVTTMEATPSFLLRPRISSSMSASMIGSSPAPGSS